MNATRRVLVVDDDPDDAADLSDAVRRCGAEAVVAPDLAAAGRALEFGSFRLVLLDRRLGGDDGLSLCTRLKRDALHQNTWIIVFSALSGPAHECDCYRAGADLLLKKGIPVTELDAYIRAYLDRPVPGPGGDSGPVAVGEVRLDPARRLARIAGTDYPGLSPLQFRLLLLLARQGGRPLSRRALIRRLWRLPVRDKEVDVLVSRLRRHLDPEHRGLIQPVPGLGYRLAVAARLQGASEPVGAAGRR